MAQHFFTQFVLNPSCLPLNPPRFVPLAMADASNARPTSPHTDLPQSAGPGDIEGRFSRRKVSVFWDLDNKPPTVQPFDAACHLKEVATEFGRLVDIVAYANRHAFIHIPQRIRDERQQRRLMDSLEVKGVVTPPEPYMCGLCGRKCKTNVDLKKHFKQLHERERSKRMNRMHSLKGKRKFNFRERIADKEERYVAAAKDLILPKVGYGLASELKRAGVYVRTVKDKPQSADEALKSQMIFSLNKGVNCLCLVSDDSDFADVLRDARHKKLKTVVIGTTKVLKRYADAWLSWEEVASGHANADAVEAVRQWSVQDALTEHLLRDSPVYRLPQGRYSDLHKPLRQREPLIGYPRVPLIGYPMEPNNGSRRPDNLFPEVPNKLSAFSEEDEQDFQDYEDEEDVEEDYNDVILEE